MAITILCGVIFLAVKLAYEWPEKFVHFGAYIKTEALEKYEPYLGNKHLPGRKGTTPRSRDHGPPAQSTRRCTIQTSTNTKSRSIQVNADPTNPRFDRPHFWPVHATDKIAHDRQEGRGTRGNVPAELTTPISPPISRSPDCTACTCSAACSSLFISGCRWAAKLYKRNPGASRQPG